MCFSTPDPPVIPPPPPPPKPPQPVAKRERRPKGQSDRQRQAAVQGTSQLRIPLPRQRS